MNVDLFSPDIGKAIIGMMLLDPDYCMEYIQANVTPDDFYHIDNKKAYINLTEIYNKTGAVDFTMATTRDASSGVWLSECAMEVSTAANYKQHVDILKKMSLRRSAAILGEKLVSAAKGEDDLDDAVEVIKQIFIDISNMDECKTSHTISEINTELISEIEEKMSNKEVKSYIPTYYYGIDSRIIGLFPGHYVLIAARPSIGKSAFALNIMDRIVEHAHRVGFISLEMKRKEHSERLTAMDTGICLTNIITGDLNPEQALAVTSSLCRIADRGNFIIDDYYNRTLTSISTRIRNMVKKQHVKVVFIDHIGLIKAGIKGNTVEKLGHISNSLKEIAMELEVPIVILSQLNRDTDKSGDPPDLCDIRWCGDIEQDANKVIMLHRKDKDSGVANVYVRKNREGSLGCVTMEFEGKCVKFNEL
jgi:replicative DNA helicase